MLAKLSKVDVHVFLWIHNRNWIQLSTQRDRETKKKQNNIRNGGKHTAELILCLSRSEHQESGERCHADKGFLKRK